MINCSLFQEIKMKDPTKPVLVVHGGAGPFRKEMSERVEACKAGLRVAFEAGMNILNGQGTALDAVEKAVRLLEDNPLFNAGRGSSYTREGRQEMDASIMDGSTLEAGAVVAVRHIRNPVSAARMVMETSGCVMLAAEGAEQFARERGAVFESDEYFHDEFRYQQYLRTGAEPEAETNGPRRMGTVGAVALDAHGNLAAATSTGGMNYKRAGRVGDSPIIGAGTYANNATCAVSCTGHGEFFIRSVVAYDISCRMEYARLNLKEACQSVFTSTLNPRNARGGLIAVDFQGNICLPFNTEGMFRSWLDESGQTRAEVF
jgi:beta-aspartyl-peptidase (threonine type)